MRDRESQKGQNSSGGPLALLICASGICGCYLYFGKIQEQMFSKDSGSKALQEVGSITSFMLVLSCFTNVLVASCWIWLTAAFTGNKNASNIGEGKTLNHLLLITSKCCNRF